MRKWAGTEGNHHKEVIITYKVQHQIWGRYSLLPKSSELEVYLSNT